MNNNLNERALIFFNAKKKDIAEGLAILKEANWKPHVIEIFEKNFNRNDIPNKIIGEVRQFLRSQNTPVVVKENIKPAVQEKQTDENPEKVFQSNLEKELQKEYPQEIKKNIVEFSDLYKKRSIAHGELKKTGEQNTKENIDKRIKIVEDIEKMSTKMETLWSAFEKYKNEAIMPEENILDFSEDNNEDDADDDVNDKFVLPTDIKKLKKLEGNLRTYITKHENLLLYQNNKALDKENPMPECPRRIKIERRLNRFKENLEKVNYAIANLS